MIRNHPIEHEHPSVSPKLRVVALLLATALLCHGELPKVEVTNIRRVFHNGEHNAFTDLAVFKGAFYLAFRSCPDGHGVSPNASIIILSVMSLGLFGIILGLEKKLMPWRRGIQPTEL